jgi:hypothetical protein
VLIFGQANDTTLQTTDAFKHTTSFGAGSWCTTERILQEPYLSRLSLWTAKLSQRDDSRVSCFLPVQQFNRQRESLSCATIAKFPTLYSLWCKQLQRNVDSATLCRPLLFLVQSECTGMSTAQLFILQTAMTFRWTLLCLVQPIATKRQHLFSCGRRTTFRWTLLYLVQPMQRNDSTSLSCETADDFPLDSTLSGLTEHRLSTARLSILRDGS